MDSQTLPDEEDEDVRAQYANLPLIPPFLQPGLIEYQYGVNFASGGGGALVDTHPGESERVQHALTARECDLVGMRDDAPLHPPSGYGGGVPWQTKTRGVDRLGCQLKWRCNVQISRGHRPIDLNPSPQPRQPPAVLQIILTKMCASLSPN
ncbi:GDSL esterase/lipase 5 [Tripterygium wilfordii]|uniref:GDSL esterase/lipase 5 n=1 Tax=Tripterygium wilfordii TaxID=458696 RepID=A0A7J7CHG4_TRIWF|nr:GDSL esterase/lipase 5 [Tripterygium wilfordii]